MPAMLLFLRITSFSQPEQTTSTNIFPIDEKTGEIVYSGIVNVDSANFKELYVRAHEWFANTFKSAQNVIQLNDKEAGKIIGKGLFEAGIPKSHAGLVHIAIIVSVDFTLEIQTKDGKYKYVFSNLSCKNSGGGEYDLKSSSFVKNSMWQKKLDEDWLEIRQDINKRMSIMIDDLKISMNSKTDNW